MTVFTFNAGIPAANNNPSVDQPDMLSNNVATNGILAVDHVTFNTTGTIGPGASGGQHLKVTFNSLANPAAPVDPISIGYTNNSATMAQVTGSATTIAQEFFRNQNGVFPVSSIRAFGSFVGITDVAPAAVTPTNSFNVSSILKATGVKYEVTLISGSTDGNNVVAIVTGNDFSSNSLINYSFTGGVLTINFSSGITGRIINFLILQV